MAEVDAPIDFTGVLFRRAMALLDLRRYTQAEQEVRQLLLREPAHGEAHTLLALAMMQRQIQTMGGEVELPLGRRVTALGERRARLEEALQEARKGIVRNPVWAPAYLVEGLVQLALDRDAAALKAVQEALRLDPELGMGYTALAQLYLRRSAWNEVLAATAAALRLDEHDRAALHLRTVALIMLRRYDEAGEVLRAALVYDPESAVTRANQGWLWLARGDARAAVLEFREALRLAPQSGWARDGLIQALRARIPLYRPLLRWLLWVSSLARERQVAVLYWISAGMRTLRILARAFPPLLFILLPLVLIYLPFVFLTWTGDLLFNLLLRLDPLGRLVLDREQIAASNGALALLAIAPIWIGVALATGNGVWLGGTIWAMAMLIPLGSLFKVNFGRRRALLGGCGALLGLSGLCGWGALLADAPWALGVVILFVVGFFLYPWVANAAIATEK